MSFLHKVELEKDDIFVTLKLDKREYENFKPSVKEYIVLPADGLDRILVTGKIGNGNRVMVPNRFLKMNGIESLRKNVPSRIFDLGNKKFLVLELENREPGVPAFEE